MGFARIVEKENKAMTFTPKKIVHCEGIRGERTPQHGHAFGVSKAIALYYNYHLAVVEAGKTVLSNTRSQFLLSGSPRALLQTRFFPWGEVGVGGTNTGAGEPGSMPFSRSAFLERFS